MITELVATEPSSDIHWGPETPTGGIPDYIIDNMIVAKNIMFYCAAVIQIAMYSLIYCKLIPIPEDDEEDGM